jgi:hypothetical protein
METTTPQGPQGKENDTSACPGVVDDLDLDLGIHKEGCCEYKFSEWGKCEDGKKFRSILGLESHPVGVPCIASEVIFSAKLQFLGRPMAWEGTSWDDCEDNLDMETTTPQGPQGKENDTSACPGVVDDLDLDLGIHKEGCCEYKFSEWGKCEDGKKFRSILGLESHPVGVPCIASEVIFSAKLQFLGRPMAWEGTSWDDCEDNLDMETTTPQGPQGKENDTSACPGVVDDLDLDLGIHKEGCCEYKFSEWGKCEDGKKFRSILGLESHPVGVPCIASEVIFSAKLQFLGRPMGWEGISWDDSNVLCLRVGKPEIESFDIPKDVTVNIENDKIEF